MSSRTRLCWAAFWIGPRTAPCSAPSPTVTGLGERMEPVAHGVVDVLVDVEALGGHADLRGVEEGAEEELLSDGVDVHVGQETRFCLANFEYSV